MLAWTTIHTFQALGLFTFGAIACMIVYFGNSEWREYRRGKARVDQLAIWAAQKGLEFRVEMMQYMPTGWVWPLDARAIHTVHGVIGGREVVVGDYEDIRRLMPYASDHPSPGEVGSMHRSYLLVRKLPAAFPAVLICPEQLIDQILPLAMGTDIAFESAEFSRAFVVRSKDRRFASQLITPPMMDLLLAHPETWLELTGSSVLIHSMAGIWTVERYAQTLEWVQRFLNLVPEFVWRDHPIAATPVLTPALTPELGPAPTGVAAPHAGANQVPIVNLSTPSEVYPEPPS